MEQPNYSTLPNHEYQRIRQLGPQSSLTDMTPGKVWFNIIWKDRGNRLWWRNPGYGWEWSNDMITAFGAPKPTEEPPKYKESP